MLIGGTIKHTRIHQPKGQSTDLSFANTVSVDDGDHAGAVGAAAGGGVRRGLLVHGAGWDGACQLGDHFPHHGQACFQRLEEKRTEDWISIRLLKVSML